MKSSNPPRKKNLIPLVKIRKIMQQDDLIGKLSNYIPNIVDRAVELFIHDLVETTTSKTPKSKITVELIKERVENIDRFFFIKNLEEDDIEEESD